MKLKIWVAQHTDEIEKPLNVVFEFSVMSIQYAKNILRDWHDYGGFWHDQKFYPYHRINYVEIIEGES